MIFHTWGIYVYLICIGLVVGLADSSLFEQDSTFTPKELAALKKFKNAVMPLIPEESYVQKFAKEDLYFMQWLRANDLKVDKAEQHFVKHLKWRETEKVEMIDQEDWSEFLRENPMFIDTYDKEGRPIVELFLADWDFRKLAVTGKSKMVNRMAILLFEKQIRNLYEARAAGKNVTRGIMLVDLNGVSIPVHVCTSCLPMHVSLIQMLEDHYPRIWEHCYILSLPSSFNIVLRLVKPILKADTRKVFTPIPNREKWLPIIEERLTRISEVFGLEETFCGENETTTVLHINRVLIRYICLLSVI